NGIRLTEISLREESAGQGPVTEQSDAASGALCGETRGRPAVDHRILHLVRSNRRTASDDFRQALPIEIRQADVAGFPGPPQPVEPPGRFDVARNAVVPPVQLDEIEALDTEALEGSVHSA